MTEDRSVDGFMMSQGWHPFGEDVEVSRMASLSRLSSFSFGEVWAEGLMQSLGIRVPPQKVIGDTVI